MILEKVGILLTLLLLVVKLGVDSVSMGQQTKSVGVRVAWIIYGTLTGLAGAIIIFTLLLELGLLP